MLRPAAVFLLLFIHCCSFGQIIEGAVIDQKTNDAIAGANILNKRSGEVVTTDKYGYYTLRATAGDTLVFRHIAYWQTEEVMPFTLGIKYKTVLLFPLAHQLKETKITGHTKFQNDSIARHDEFGHQLARILVPKPKYVGLGCVGCVGWLADKITDNSKIPKRFKKEFAADDRTKFTDSRYSPALVTSLTGIRDTDSVAAFIYAYPMPYDFARAASDLEIKVWIRENYKQYLQMPIAKREE